MEQAVASIAPAVEGTPRDAKLAWRRVIPQKWRMKTSDADILFIPGLGGSGPDHWQSRWAAKLSTGRLLGLAELDRPNRQVWVDAIVRAVAACERPVVLVAHSLGAVAVAHAAPLLAPGKARGAMLVAPPDETTLLANPELTGFSRDFSFASLDALPFASALVASRNDPLSPFGASEALAKAWGAKLLDAGEAGHINAESGHGPWPEGLMSFAGFLKGL